MHTIEALSGMFLPRKGDFSSRRVNFPILVTGLYGQGANGIVFQVVDSSSKQFALRVGDMDEATVILQQVLADRKLAPQIYHVGTVTGLNTEFTVMQLIHGTLDNYFEGSYNSQTVFKAISCLLDMKTILKMVHGDMHTGNIAILEDGQNLGFIDLEFAFVVPYEEFTVIDFIPLIATLPPDLQVDVANYYRETFNITLRIRDIKSRRGGGFEYENLGSYVEDESELVKMERKVLKLFPSIRVRPIVPVRCNASL